MAHNQAISDDSAKRLLYRALTQMGDNWTRSSLLFDQGQTTLQDAIYYLNHGKYPTCRDEFSGIMPFIFTAEVL
jgi:hypothetical protein